MLQKIRDGRRSVWGWIVIGLIVLVMGAFGMGTFFTPDPDPPIAEVNGVEISAIDYQNRYNQYLTTERNRLGERFNAQVYETPIFRRQFLDSMIEESLIQNTLLDSGLTISNSELRNYIQAVPSFQIDGQFDGELYQLFLRGSNQTPDQFEQTVRRDLLMRQLPQLLGSSSVATSKEAMSAAGLQGQTRSFDYIPLNVSEFRDAVTVGEDDLQQYYDDNPQSFMDPEKVVIEYVELRSDDFLGEVEVTEPMLEERYELRKEQLRQEERRLVSHILIEGDDGEQRAAELAQRAQAGEDFAALAEEYSQDPGSASLGGDLGWVSRGDMVEEFGAALFELNPGDISDPIQTEFGYHVINLREIEGESQMSFDEARIDLMTELSQELARNRFDEVDNELRDLAFAQSSTLEPLAERLGTTVATSEPFSALGGEGIAQYPQVAQIAFTDDILQERRNSDGINLEDGHVVYVRVSEYIEPQRKSLEEVSDQIAEQLKTERATESLNSKADAIYELAQGGQALAAIAEAESLELQEAIDTGRFANDVPFTLSRAVFALPRPETEQPTIHLVDNGVGGKALVALKTITDAQVETADDATIARISRAYASAEFQALVAQLREQASIEIDESQFRSN